MATPDFPNGFESWQKTHFEVVEVLVYLRNLDEAETPHGFTEMLDRSATDDLYRLALELTNTFEKQSRSAQQEGTLFDQIEVFVQEELKKRHAL